MFGELLFLALAAAAVGGFVYWRRRARGSSSKVLERGPATVWNIGPGDLIEVEGTMMDVERALDCNEAASPGGSSSSPTGTAPRRSGWRWRTTTASC